MKRIALVVMITLIAAAAVTAQRGSQRVKQVQQAYGDQYYADAVILPNTENDSAAVQVRIRVNTSTLVFSKVNSFQEQRGEFYATIGLSVEARDAVGVVRQRVRFVDTVFVDNYETLAETSSYRSGVVTLSLAAGSYNISIEPVTNRDNGFRKLSLPKVVIPKTGQKQLGNISCIFAHAATQEYDLLVPYVFNGNLPFPSSRVAVIATIPQSLRARSFDVWIRQQPYQKGDIRWWTGVDIHTTVSDRSINLDPTDDGNIAVRATADLKSTGRSIVIPVNASDVVPGRYLLTLVAEGTSDTLRYAFNVEWESMPLSLRSLSYALDVLAYVCPEETLDSLREGDDAAQREQLMDWWRRQDKTLGTAHNERMAEYYRRVDRASYSYATLLEPDGAFTDRGKVYILYGEPTKVDRKTNKAGDAVETWIYNNGVRTVFVFTIEEDGQYRLTTVQPLRK
jgi:GWxTD domain-containing protein